MKARVLIFLLSTLWVGNEAFAKKVKFAVDMTDQTLSPNGIHISGDFQTIAGFPGGNWNSATTPLLPESNPMIFSAVVDIPANRKYEYKFINGDQFYEAEFVPEPSRVGHDFNDNRWIFVDSLSTDTFFVGAIKFGGNAPEGLKLIRFAVDLAEVNPVNAVHLGGNFSGWDYQKNQMFSFVNKLYEIILFVPSGNYQYSFANGNSLALAENVPISCAGGVGKRIINLQSDSVLSTVCFGKCDPCITPISLPQKSGPFVQVFPNPSVNQKVRIESSEVFHFELLDATGKIIGFESEPSDYSAELELPSKGIFFLRVVMNSSGNSSCFKILSE